MIKIINPGSIDNMPKNKWYKTTCDECRCVFEFQRFEAKEYWGDQREPAQELHIACPTCKSSCRVEM